MNRTATSLSDGRDLIYFDEAPHRVTPVQDSRTLGDRPTSGELRHDALNDEWIAVAGHRQTRTFQPAATDCPLCPSHDGLLSEVPESSFEVAVFENRFPSFQQSEPHLGWPGPSESVHRCAPNRGRCEVIVFSADHDARFCTLSATRVRTIVDAWADRTTSLMSLPYVEHVFPFENCGAEIGVTLPHPHGQIYGYPFVAPRAMTRLEAAARYAATTGRLLIDDLISAELDDGSRVVASTEHWVVFVPFAARWPFQVQIHPRRSIRTLPELDDCERDDFADLYPRVLKAFDELFGIPMPYIAAWFQAPKGELAQHARLYLEVFSNRRAADKLKFLAGSEAAMGAFINDIPPEQSARMLREGIS